MAERLEALYRRLSELKDLSGAIGLLTWDQETYLPRKAEQARADQLATLQAIHHERLVDATLGGLLDELGVRPELDADARALIRVTRWERDRAVKMPESLVRELALAQSRGLTAWREARAARAFWPFRDALGRLLELRRAQADALGFEGGEPYDALLEGFEPGMRVSRLDGVLASLAAKLTPVVTALCARPPPRDWLEGDFAPAAQWRLSERLLADMGFDSEAGRLDKSVHPFTGGTHATDVRLTTRVDPNNLRSSLYGTIHECGHGLYEQGFDPDHHRSPLGAAPSMGLHESQSRLWENMVGRSRPFWRYLFPLVQAEFPQALAGADAEGLYRSANKVGRGAIRVDSDEVTYNLHIVLRYQLELLLMRDELPLEDLPEEWNRRTQELVGVRPENDLEGVLQDIHWAAGELGYFPTYSLGNLYAASFFAAARRELPDLEASIARGELGVLRQWLRRRIHQEGNRHPAETLVQRVTGQGLTEADFVTHVKTKYGELYGVTL
jgi:carboxypeptidase Taq